MIDPVVMKKLMAFPDFNWKAEVSDISSLIERHPIKEYKRRGLSSINKVVVHTTDRDWCIDQLVEFDVRGKLTYVRKYDGEKVTDVNQIDPSGLPGPTYHETILKEGQSFKLLDYKEVSYHAGGYNTGSVAIALMYRVTNPETNKDTFAPTLEQMKSLRSRCGELCLMFGLEPDRVFGHRELKGTGWFLSKSGSKRLRKTCPGMNIDLNILRYDVARYMQILLSHMCGKYYQGKIDGDFGPKSKAALELYKQDMDGIRRWMT